MGSMDLGSPAGMPLGFAEVHMGNTRVDRADP